MPKKKTDKQKPDVHEDLKDFEIKINEFGEITTNMDVSKLNKFLDKNVDDKKLRGLEGEDDDDYVDANEEGKEEEEKEESIDDILTDQEEE